MGTRTPRRRRKYNPSHVKTVVQAVMMVLLVVALCLIVGKNIKLNRADRQPGTDVTPPAVSSEAPEDGGDGGDDTPLSSDAPGDEPAPTPTPEPFEPHCVDSTDPSNYISYTNVMVDGEMLDGPYETDTEIYLGDASEYSALPGVITFGGNNYRNTNSYGTAELTNKKFGSQWTAPTGSAYHADDGGRVELLVGQRLDGPASAGRVAEGDAADHEHVRLGEGGGKPRRGHLPVDGRLRVLL